MIFANNNSIFEYHNIRFTFNNIANDYYRAIQK